MLPSNSLIQVQNWLNNYLKKRLSEGIYVELDSINKSWLLRIDSNTIQFPICAKYYLPSQFSNCGKYVDRYSRMELIFPCDQHIVVRNENTNHLLSNKIIHKLDVLGIIFWTLNRAEEYCQSITDCHNRTIETNLNSVKFGYEKRPIVDEWILHIRSLMQIEFNYALFNKHFFSKEPTHDIDVPYFFENQTRVKKTKSIVGLLRKKKITTAAKLASGCILTTPLRKKFLIEDPFDTYDFLMSQSEAIGVKSRFFIKTGASNRHYDNFHEWKSNELAALLRSIQNRGHLLGHHPSYEAFSDLNTHLDEIINFKNIIGKPSNLHSRQHFLRWSFPDTLHKNSTLGIHFDYTLGFNDRVGFRCGSSHEFLAFDLVNYRTSTLCVRPLIFMECALLTKVEKELYPEECYNALNLVVENCRLHLGKFSFVWHNSHFKTEADYSIYRHLMKA